MPEAPRPTAMSKEAMAIMRQRAMERFKEALDLAERLGAKGVPMAGPQQALDSAEAALRQKDFQQALLLTEEAIARLHGGEKEFENQQRARKEIGQRLEELRKQLAGARAAGADTTEAEGPLQTLETALAKAQAPAQFQKILAGADIASDLIERAKERAATDRRELTEVGALVQAMRTKVADARRRAPPNLEARLTEQLTAVETAFTAKQWAEARYRLEVLGPTLVEVEDYYARAERTIAKAEEMLQLTKAKSDRIDLSAAEGAVKSARDSLAKRDFAAVPVVREAVRRALQQSVEQHRKTLAVKDQAERALSTLVETIEQLETQGFDVRPIDVRLEKSRALFMRHDYAGALAQVEEGETVAEGLRSQHQAAADAIVAGRDAVDRVAVHSEDKDLRARLEKAEKLLLERKYAEAALEAKNLRAAADEFSDHAEPAVQVKLPAGLQPKVWNRTSIDVTNRGRAHAKNVEIKLKGPLETMSIRPIDLLKAGTTAKVDLGIKPNDVGELPVDVEIACKRAADDKPMSFPATEWLHVTGAATGKDGTPAPVATPEKTSLPVVEWFAVKELFLIYNDGRLVHRASPAVEQAERLDDEVWSSMLVAVQSFVADSFRGGGGLDSFEFGESKVILHKGQYTILATVLEGREPSMLREQLTAAMEKVEGLYAGIIEAWDGDTTPFKDVENHLRAVLDLGKRVKMREEQGEVRVMSALEFYQGYVRLKVAIINKTAMTVNDCTLKLHYNKTALRFDHAEPGYPLDGTGVEMGAVKPNEKKTVAFFLDPLICMETTINCTLTYFDPQGKINNLNMKERPVDIVCPIFYTPQTVNTAMLKRLLGELSYRDVRSYYIRPPLPPSAALGLLKDAIQGHAVRFVREIIEDNPYHAEAWYYGKTQSNTEEMVLMCRVRGADSTVSVLVASSNLANMTGLLAELGQNLGHSIQNSEWRNARLELVTEAELRDSLASAPYLLDKYEASVAPETPAGA